jgi:dTDP-4-amino-4,6-dideoxy-D-galactose acyltransferase
MHEITSLDWDSEFFGYKVGKIEVTNQSDFNLEDFFLKSKEFKLVYVFSKEDINIENFKLVDRKVVLIQNISSEFIYEDTSIESFDVNVHDYNQLKELALESGIYSRFFVDENFVCNEYFNLYNRWIDNSVIEKMCFDVLVAINNNKIVGFTTLLKKSDSLTDIGLVAVSKESRGLGIGKRLMNESIIRSKKGGFKEIQVITQLDNIAAINLYKSVNFKIKEITNIYHLWNR